MFNPVNAMWTEKWRPKKVSEMVGSFKFKILQYLKNPESIPHFLLYSKTPGTGKTTLAKAIINELGCDALVLNSSDDRKIEVIREKVKEFSMTQSSVKGLRRCVFLDEFDGMLKTSQDALRNVMETYAKNVFFILTCNNINKVIEPLKSRCVTIAFEFPDMAETKNYLKMICVNEKMNFTEEGLDKLMELNYPSIRNCVLKLQDLYTEQKPVTIETVKPLNEIFTDLWKKIHEKDWKYVKKVVMKSSLDTRELNTYFWEMALNSDPPELKIVQICCRNEKDIAWGSNPQIIFVTSLIEMLK